MTEYVFRGEGIFRDIELYVEAPTLAAAIKKAKRGVFSRHDTSNAELVNFEVYTETGEENPYE